MLKIGCSIDTKAHGLAAEAGFLRKQRAGKQAFFVNEALVKLFVDVTGDGWV